ncbi:MAG TPA: class I SAM-dependent methyltransferase [Steroidobacteraceae bacterium]|nr:class I SAM-dependent methyltransferase [Steroidobacteraceae bacterium]
MSLRHWETYYRGGALASCPMSPDGGYTLELREAWTEFFGSLRNGASVLDIGTGNGAIALLARETADALGRRFEIRGTDLAGIDPVRDVQDGTRRFAGIRFHAHVATEHLPFAECEFDAVSGQYALEYSEPEPALAEIHRVLKLGGRARFILHHSESVLVQNARASLAQAALVFEDTRVFRKLRRLLEAERAPGRAARTAHADLMAALAVLQSAAASIDNALTLDVTVDAVQKLLAARRAMPPAACSRRVDQAEDDIRASVRRLHDLVGASRSAADMQSLGRLASASGFEVAAIAPQRHAGTHVVGWRMDLVRPGQ